MKWHLTIRKNFYDSYELTAECFSFFMNNKDLIGLPLISMLACIDFILLVFLRVKPAIASQDMIVILFLGLLSYFALAFIAVFFNAALIACVILRMRGNPGTVWEGFKIALSRLPQLFMWSMFTSTVGLLVRSVESSHSVIRDMISDAIGFVWTVLSYFVVPIIICEGLFPRDALQENYALVKKGWRRALGANIVLGVYASIAFCFILGIMKMLETSKLLLPVLGIVFFIYLVVFTILGNALDSILTSALYLYVNEDTVPQGMQAPLLDKIIYYNTDTEPPPEVYIEPTMKDGFDELNIENDEPKKRE